MQSTTYTSKNTVVAPTVERVLLPTQIIEKAPAIHEEIRKELIEEVQPVINVEKVRTEVRQVTQPLFDKEVRAVQIENRTLNTEVLPEVFVEGRGARAQADISTTTFRDTQTVVVEKPALYTEVERKQIIEEIQPVIYKETVVPTVIQETKPIYQKVVEGTVYSQETLPAREVAVRSVQAAAYVPSTEVVAPIHERVFLPTQIVEKPTAVHEEIRRETIEEVQPVFSVEKLKTEIHQITAPLYDKEVKPVLIEKKILATEILPEVLTEGRGMRAVDDMSSTRYLDTRTTIVEKPAVYNEIERTQIIEEIQPVLYKETVVPTVIRETKPVFQKIVEGPVYTQQTLAPRSLHDTSYRYPVDTTPIVVPTTVPVVIERVAAPVVVVEEKPHGRKEITEEIITTTTTTTAAPVMPEAKHHLFGRNKETVPSVSSRSASALPSSGLTSLTGAPVEHFHNERSGPNGQKVIEDTTVSRSHTETHLPARRI